MGARHSVNVVVIPVYSRCILVKCIPVIRVTPDKPEQVGDNTSSILYHMGPDHQIMGVAFFQFYQSLFKIFVQNFS